MGTVYTALLAVSLLCNLSALAQQPTPLLPDPKLTPGDVFDVTAQDICVSRLREEGAGGAGMAQKKGTRTVRNHGVQDRRLRSGSPDSAVARRIQFDPEPLAPIDRNVALELLCERRAREETPPARLRRRVRSQDRPAGDRVELDRGLKKYVSENPPAPAARETSQTPVKPAAADEVWVNTRSGKYWKPGSRFYGKTKQGEYMPELDALDRGYSPAGGTGR